MTNTIQVNKVSEEHTYKLEGYEVDIEQNFERESLSIYIKNKDEEADVNNEKLSLTGIEAYKLLKVLTCVLQIHDKKYEEKKEEISRAYVMMKEGLKSGRLQRIEE
jgi:molybdenum cofactor biosynthesis enzyme